LKNVWDFDVIGGQSSPIPIDFARGPYHSTACDIFYNSTIIRLITTVCIIRNSAIADKPRDAFRGQSKSPNDSIY